MVIELLINGLTVGGIYALIAIGFTLILGVLRVFHIAHGEVYMMGAYLTFGATGIAGGIPFPFLILLSLLSGALVGLVIERGIYAPLSRAPHTAPLICSIGLIFVLQNTAMLVWGPEMKSFSIAWDPGFWRIMGIEISVFKVLIAATTLLLAAILHAFLVRTQFGRAIRATALDSDTALLMGIETRQVNTITFVIGSGLAGAAGVMVGLFYGVIYPVMGLMALVKGYTASIIGGVGNIIGAFIGGILLGELEMFTSAYISNRYSDSIVLFVLILMLLLRPSGLLGKKEPELF
jgi:branched-chain amino acid transport system permease protein